MTKRKADIIESLDQFTRAYIECLLWSSSDGDLENFDDYDTEDLTVRALKDIVQDCQDFQQAQSELLEKVSEVFTRNGWSYTEQNGHDFCLTRNGHGAGFWDRGYGELGQKLTEACRPYGTQGLYLHRGKLYTHS